jgi:hypothetical protein
MNIDNSNIPFADKVQLLTIRDQLAAAALTGLFADNPKKVTFWSNEEELTLIAEKAYKAADAMLAARAK